MNLEQFLAYAERLDEITDQAGWVCQGVFPTAEDPGYHWVYTIGMSKGEHPDFVIVGLPNEVAQTVLNALGDRVMAGENFASGDRLSNVVKPREEGVVYDVGFVEVPKDRWSRWFGIGLDYYELRQIHPYGWLQVVWPDDQGLLPWEDGFNQRFADVQPVLGSAPASRPTP